jgi:hypothetical protein
MAKRSKAKQTPPRFILNPDLADDSDEDPPVMGTPDDDGWVYLNRSQKPKEGEQRAKSKGKHSRGGR